MNYLEVKLEDIQEDNIDTESFVSSVIENQQSLGLNKIKQRYNKNKLLQWGFIYNSSTGGFYIYKEFNLEELEDLAKKVSSLENHFLSHSYIILKIYKDELYFWDTSLIYEGVDSFEYCLKHHNLFTLGKLKVLSNSDSVNEELLKLANYTKRYHEPTLGFITQGCVWDKKEGIKILKSMVKDINEYLTLDEVIAY